MQPTPALYLRDLGYVEGAAEFERREGPGALDLARIFGGRPSCYGQPGNSWAPQSNAALRHMGIPVYLAEGSQVGLNDQPFWYGGLLYIYNMGRFQLRAPLDGDEPAAKSNERFERAAAELRSHSGGVISIYYHPTEFVTTEFWDAVCVALPSTVHVKGTAYAVSGVLFLPNTKADVYTITFAGTSGSLKNSTAVAFTVT